MLLVRRMMQKFRGKPFHDSIDIVDSQLTLIDQETICWSLTFEERHGSFGSPNSTDERADQQCDDAKMRDEKGKMMFAPGPTGESRDGKVRSEQNEPEIEPRRPVNVGARDLRIEARFIDRASDRGDDEHREQNNRQFKRRKKFEDRVALPGRLPG